MGLDHYIRRLDHDLDVESCVAIERLGRGFLTLFADGSVWGWGSNNEGQLGLGDDEGRTDPTRIGGLEPVAVLAAGYSHAIALSGDGAVWFWGSSAHGQSGLGIPERDEHESKVLLTPVRIPSLPPIVAIAAGGFHNLALDTNGAVWAWGDNELGALGLGREGTRRVSVPERVLGLPAIREVAALGAHSAAISEAGELWMWGWNVSGMLADGGTTMRARPGVVPLPAAVDRIALGARHILAQCIDGSLWGWGNNDDGQLGHGDKVSRLAPARIEVPCVPDELSALASGSALRCPDGSVWVWGFLRLDWQAGGRPLVGTRPATSARPILLEDPRVLASRAPLPVRLQLRIFDRVQDVLIIR